MTHRHIARLSAAVVLALSLGACVTARRPAPEPIVDLDPSDAVTLPAEYHHAQIGHDRLRGPLPGE
jgi:hypothetical protein